MISSPVGVMTVLVGTAAFFFWLARATGWRVFQYLVPLIWIYATPMVLRNVGVLPGESGAYDLLGTYGLPMFITLLLLSVDVGAAVRVMGRGLVVMLIGTAGVVLGAPVGYFAVRQWLDPEAWKGFGALAGSWIGGTGNMAAVAGGLETPPDMFGLAVLADTVIYIGWLPLLLGSKALADRFNRWTRVSEERLELMEAAAAAEATEEAPPAIRHVLYLGVLALTVTWISGLLAPLLPEIGQILSTSTWRILLVTTFGIALSFTPARRIPSSHNLAMALVYVFVARMGASASLEGLTQAPAFLLGAAIWIVIHGLFCLGGAWLLKVDVHSAAIASAANIGGAASAPVVAAYHRESLVPVSILMALIGYAVGNYCAFVAAWLCAAVAPG
ncbi:MAG TPA: DUF819 family protein [Thermoanaerobaculia bacterium]|nr:DUF819 family protein [Thermoanaerobaculia bacterium]